MIPIGKRVFREVWLVDFEFSAPPGEQPSVVCMVAHEIGSGKRIRVWQDELIKLKWPPYAICNDTLFVAYYASAEMGCHLKLNWPLPVNVLDLYVEFRNHTNGLTLPCGTSLLGALVSFGLSGIESSEKETMRQLAMRGGPYTQKEKEDLLNYCESDVIALEKLLLKINPFLDIPRALIRGRYMKTAAQIEHNGIPIDVNKLALLRKHWIEIQDKLIAEIDSEYGVFDQRTFKYSLFAAWLQKNEIPWPRLLSGKLDLSDEVFKEMARSYPKVAPLRELRVTLSQMRLAELSVGQDNRNRCLLSAFRSRTGRNQPSNNQFIFGPAVWLRSLIKPSSGYGLAYIDWSQQEFGIAAALSGDSLMIKAYQSGDPYLEFAKQANAIPINATKTSHKSEREQFKACVLAVQYGMGADSLAQRINQPVAKARELLRLHKETYKQFWEWIEAVVNYAMLIGRLHTVFGWNVYTEGSPNPRFLQNFPMQANGAEMLRLACCFVIEAGIKLCAPVHDAILIEAPLNELEQAVQTTQQLMAEASAIVLNGFRLRTDATYIRYPDHYEDERGKKMREAIDKILLKFSGKSSHPDPPGVGAYETLPAHLRTPVQSYYLSI
ncbi:MAG: DNA polymerase I [Proteobacteria bacterium]|nr:DNA polymerase I [Pseudomonadota bacterium]